MIKRIKKALRALGVTEKPNVVAIYYGVAEVEINGKYFGLFDLLRETFVD